MKRLLRMFIILLCISSFILYGCDEDPKSDDNQELTAYEIFQIVNENASSVHSNYLVNAEILINVYNNDETTPSQIVKVSYTNEHDGKNLYIYEETTTIGKNEEGKDVASTSIVQETFYDNNRYVSYVTNVSGEIESEDTIVKDQEIPSNYYVNLALPFPSNKFDYAKVSKENANNVITIPASIDVCAIITTKMLPSLNMGISASAYAYEGTLQYIYDDSYNFIGVILDAHIHLDDDAGLAFDYIYKLELAEHGNVQVKKPLEK